MRLKLVILLAFISTVSYCQVTRIDSSVVHRSLTYYIQSGYYIGKDSFHTKRVRVAYCNDTLSLDYDTLIQRMPQRFITMDSIPGGSCPECGVPLDDLNDTLINYVQKYGQDTIYGLLKIFDHPTHPSATNPGIFIESASNPYYMYIDAINGIQIYNISASANTQLSDNKIVIDRQSEYTPTDPNDVLVQSEIKELISDSIATRPTLTTVRNEISDSIATVSAPDLSGYLKSNANDTVSTYYTLWKNGSNEVKVDNTGTTSTDGTNTAQLQANQFYITDGSNLSGVYGYNNAYIYDDSDASKIDLYSNHLTIDRSGYSATGSNEVPIVSEVKALINDSLDTRLALYTPNGDLEEKIQDEIGAKLVEGTNITLTYNDATGETTVDAAGASGLSTEAVYDTIAYNLRVGEGLSKTKDDAGDSLLIELKLKDALERIVWSTGCHKAVFMATNTTGGTAHWGFQISGTGTVTQPTKSTTNRFQFANRWETLVTSASTTAVAGYRTSNGISGFGNASGMGGFYYNGVAGAATGLSNTNARFFFGYSNSTSAPTDVNPSTLTNMFGIAYDASDGNLQFMHNDASGTATKVDLGSDFAVTTTDRTNFYRLIMYAESNGSTVYYKVIDMVDGDVYTGSVSTNLPSNTTMFGPYGYTSVGGSSAVTGFSLMSLEIFSDY